MDGSTPGDLIMRWLEEHGHSQTWLAAKLGISLKHVNRIVHAQAGFSPELALQLQKVTRIPARIWMHLQADWALQRAVEAQRQRRRRRRRPPKDTQQQEGRLP